MKKKMLNFGKDVMTKCHEINQEKFGLHLIELVSLAHPWESVKTNHKHIMSPRNGQTSRGLVKI